MTRPALSSPELHRNCIVHEIGKLGCMLMTNTSQNQRQTANDERQKKTVKKAKTVKTAKTATAAKDQRTANGQGRFDKSVTVCLCRSLSVFMNIVAIFQVNIQQHTHAVSRRKRINANVWDSRYGATRTRLTLSASVRLCQFQPVSICTQNATARTFSTVEHGSAAHFAS